MTTPKVEARHLFKAFHRGETRTNALNDINLTVRAGEFVALLGASGCGKTTLLRIVDGLETASEGELLIDGRPQNAPGTDRGFVFQQDNLLPWRTVLRNVTFGLELQGVNRRTAQQQATEYLELVGLKGFEKYYPHELSGGMRQRVNLARAFTIRPDILLMDEPFAALDAQTREVMQTELLRMWQQTDGRTVMFVTHQIDEAIYLADRIVVMTARPGRVKEIIDVPFARPRTLDLKRSPEFSAIYDRIWKTIEEEVRASMAMT
ncbi:ABC transporter ATP-binding protein [Micromonospora wenchangensis]|uniref:ABC transporter ATP-binding protein n=1 Tax=Micromonospora wenchangensis TaxID=1185415 RepID=UPI003D74B83A